MVETSCGPRRHRHATAATPIRKVGVIGAGVMGAGIAAQVANAGVPVVLLDIVPGGAADAKARRADAEDRPGALHAARPRRRLVTPGNIEDDLAALAECDWIVEAIVERPDVKQALYAQAGGGAEAGLDRLLQHLDHPARGAGRGAGRGLRRRLPHHPFLQPAALHAAAGGRRGPATRPEALAAIAEFGDRRARQDRRRLQGPAGLHRQPHRHLLDAERHQRARSTSA